MLSALLHDDPHSVGPYRLLARLGSGGMGTVYLARTAGGRTVAVKTLHARLSSDTALRSRFQLEADAARVIGGRHGAAVHDADPSAPRPWLATEYVLGPPLDDAVAAGGALPAAAVRVLGAALAEGLEQLHRSEAVHRDLKPSNVMVTASGPKIIDFGIARAVGEVPLTHVGDAVGTPAFMSPEQAAGLEHTAAGDVFALAGVLVFAVTGHGPFGSGQPTDLLYRVRYAEPDLGGVPPELVPVLSRCLSKNAADRPTTAELAKTLVEGVGPHRFADVLPDAVLREIARRGDDVWRQPPHRLPPPPPETVPDTAPARPGMSRRKMLAVTGGGALAGAGLAGGGVWAWLGSRGGAGGADDEGPAKKVKAPSRLWTSLIRCPDSRGEVRLAGHGLAVPAGIVLSGINPESGEATWQANIADPWRSATDGTKVYALREHDEGDKVAVWELDPTDGQPGKPLVELSAFAGDEPRNQLLCVVKDSAYLVARAASGKRWYLVAVDLRGGRERWRSPVEAATDAYEPPMVSGSVDGDRILLYQADSFMNSLDVSVHALADGKKRWSNSGPSYEKLPGPLVHDERHVYLGDKVLEADKVSDGSIGWLFGDRRNVGGSAGEARLYGSPALRDGVVYCTEGDRGIVAVDAATGSLNWLEKGLTGRQLNRDVPPVVGKKYVYSLDDKGLRAVDLRTHRAVWTYETTATVLTADHGRGRLYVREERQTFALPLV